MRASPFSADEKGVRVALKVTARASRERVEGVALDPDGSARLALKVTAPPEGGRANEAVRRLLAGRWRLPAGALSILAGAGSTRKLLLVEGDAKALLARLTSVEGKGDGSGS